MSFERSIVAHIPVISRSYLDFINSQQDVDSICVLDETVVGKLDGIRKDLRKLSPNEVTTILQPTLSVPIVELGAVGLRSMLETTETTLVMPNDEVTKIIVEDYGIPSDRYLLETLFLRWDRINTALDIDVIADETVEASTIPVSIRKQLQHEISQSSDWWRQVGCVVFDSTGNITISSHNSYVPSDATAEIDGDIRSQAYRGMSIDVANAQHAEAHAVALAANEGLALNGKDCLVSTFPCAVCSKIIADTGIRKLYFIDGYATADGFDVLKAADVEIIRVVEFEELSDKAKTRPVTYPAST